MSDLAAAYVESWLTRDFLAYDRLMNSIGMTLSPVARGYLTQVAPASFQGETHPDWKAAPEVELLSLLWSHPEWRGAEIVRIDTSRASAGTGLAMSVELTARGSNSQSSLYNCDARRAALRAHNAKEEGAGAAWVMFPATLRGVGKFEGERTLLIRLNFVYRGGQCFPIRLDWIGDDYRPRLLF